MIEGPLGFDPELEAGVDPELELAFDPELEAGFHPELELEFHPELEAGFDPELELVFRPELEAGFDPELEPLEPGPSVTPHPTPRASTEASRAKRGAIIDGIPPSFVDPSLERRRAQRVDLEEAPAGPAGSR